MSRHGEMQDPAPFVSQNHEYVQHPKVNRRHREEVDRYHTLDVILQEGPPSLRRRLAVSRHIFANAGFANLDAQLEQFSVNPRSTPEWILAAHIPNQCTHLFR